MQTFPIFLALQDRPVLVVGGGEPAARKVELLLSADARASRSRAVSSCALPILMTASSRPSLMTAPRASSPSAHGPGLAVRMAADSARRAEAKGCSPASR